MLNMRHIFVMVFRSTINDVSAVDPYILDAIKILWYNMDMDTQM